MLKVEDIINKLQELKNDDYFIEFNVEPEINRFENITGKGVEEVRYTFEIILKQKEPYIRKYQNNRGIIEYYDK